MKRTLTFLTALLMISLAVPHAADAKSSKPNILFIYTDDQRWDVIG